MTQSKSEFSDQLILTIDVGSSSVRASLYDQEASVKDNFQSRRNYNFETTSAGGVEFDADVLFKLVLQVIDEVLERCGKRCFRIAAVAMSTFWHNLVGINVAGQAMTPIYSWADTRSSKEAEGFRQRIDEVQYHGRTGCVIHPSYLPSKLIWIKEAQPQTFRKVARWMSFGEYCYLKFFGIASCSFSMASGTGLFNQNLQDWDNEVLEILPIERNQLSPLIDLDNPLRGLIKPFSSRWPSLNRIPWLPAIGDGACSNIGSGCSTPKSLALMVGTSGAMRVVFRRNKINIPQGLWCYRVDRHRLVMGGALSNGGLLVAWMRETLQLPQEKETLECQIAEMEPSSHGLTILPFLAGERSPGWHSSARATIKGLSLHTKPLDIFRASLESVAYRFAKIEKLLTPVVPENQEIIASGGGILHSPTWLQIMADVLAKPIFASGVREASSRGAALLALEVLGYTEKIEDVKVPMGSKYVPNWGKHDKYLKAMEETEQLYQLMLNNEF